MTVHSQQTVLWRVQGNLAIVEINNGSRNLLSLPVRRALLERLQEAEARGDIDAVVLAGQGAMFSGGVDLAELENPVADCPVADVCSLIEGMQTAVIGALHGLALGAGFEVALACHARVVHTGAHAGFPGISLGLLPDAGGTQRLPRLVGSAAALEALAGGRMQPICGPVLRGLVDHSGSDDVIDMALAFAKVWLDHPERRSDAGPPDKGLADPAAYMAAITEARAALEGRYAPIQTRLVDCVEAALLLPVETAHAYEKMAAEDSRASDYSKGLRHSQLALRRAPNYPARARGTAQKIASIGFVGGSKLAAGLAVQAALTDRDVAMYQRDSEGERAAQANLREAAERATPNKDPEAILAKISTGQDIGQMAAVDLVMETVADHAESKDALFQVLAEILPRETIRVCSTGVLSLTPFAQSSAAPDRFVGMYVHDQTMRNPMVELMPVDETSDDTMASVAQLLADLGRVSVYNGGGGGSLGFHMQNALREAAWIQMLQGLHPAQIDRSLRGFGFAQGVFQQLDQQGLEAAASQLRNLHGHDRFAHSFDLLLDLLIQSGRTGAAAGAGVFKWEGGKASPDQGLDAVMPDLDAPGLHREDEQIAFNCLAAMVNQGAKLLRSGDAMRPSDLDTIMVQSFGFPRYWGGPMNAADLKGIFEIQKELQTNTPFSEDLYAPEPGLQALVKNGMRFGALNGLGRARKVLPA